ncbi:TPA: HNH endonuclease [Pasteurella multocida]|uniref:HNH endonuclease n=2 Tax=Pasteurella multocida TaxID=747 RepID=UPI002023465C|nr:HNH endonuclease [Pasteurella multocida]URH96767.1 HNH endonuclease [Pasteurella multocida]
MGKRVDIEAGGNLHIESRQDESRFDSRSTQAGVNAEMSFGNAWSANGNVSAERGKSNYKQVRELSGIMAEEGGYHVVAENVHLKGAVIASTNPAQSELTTNRFSFEDIKNESSYSASSASISGGYSKGREYYRDADTHKVVSAGSKDAEFIAGKKGANFNAGLPMHSEGNEESLTKATLTAGRITLNKDSQPIETTADALGINTDLSQAQREVSKPKDVTQLLAEQKEIAKAVGEIKSAVEIYTSNQQEEAELAVKRAKKALAQAEQTGNQAEIRQKQTALFAAEEAQAKWGDKGEYKRTAERLTTLLTGILAKQAAGGIATQLISPEVNQWIKQATTNDKGETDKIANTLAHAIWGAIEATANRGNPTSGAIAAASAELAAPMLAKVLYNKDKAEHLTAEEKAQITALSSMTAAVAGGLTAQGSSQSNTTVSSLTNASIGGEIGKVAVENNYLSLKDVSAYQRALKKAIQNGESVEEVHKYFKALSEKQRAMLLETCDIDCRVTVPNELLAAIGFADDLSGLVNSWVRGLPLEEQTKFYQLVEAENIKMIQALKAKQGSVEKGVELAMDMARFFAKEETISSSSAKKSLYDPKQIRHKIEKGFEKEEVKSTTVVMKARSTVTNKVLKTGEAVSVIESEGGKAVKIYAKPDQFGHRQEIANIPYDKRGLPIFDDVSKFTTKIEKPKNYQEMNSQSRRTAEMKSATFALKQAIERGEVNKNQFTDQQLKEIYSGKAQIDKYTWHHNGQSSPNNMQLIPKSIHEAVQHIGEGALSEGR